MGRYSPGQKPGALLNSVTLATGATGTAVSAAQSPVSPARWNVTAFSAVAPTGTDGALIFYKASKAPANQIAVVPIGELTSENLNIPFIVDATNSLVIEAVGIPQNVANNVTVNLIGVSQ
jgi:hypothetical protein